jgi:hypothetical protein
MKILELKDNTTPAQILYGKYDHLKVYHSCSIADNLHQRFKISNKNIHAGSMIQAIWRADYKVNDQETYAKAYVHEILIELGNVLPELVNDAGFDVDQDQEDIHKPMWDTLLYHNTGEGFANRENLSVIILNKNNIKNITLHSTWRSDDLKQYEQLHFVCS